MSLATRIRRTIGATAAVSLASVALLALPSPAQGAIARPSDWSSSSSLVTPPGAAGQQFDDFQMVVSADGSRAVAAWSYGDGTPANSAVKFQAASNTSGSWTWGTESVVSINAPSARFYPQVAISENGQFVTAVWVDPASGDVKSSSTSVAGNVLAWGGTVTPVTVVSTGTTPIPPQLAMSADGGTVTALWGQGAPTTVFSRSASVSGGTQAWGPAVAVDTCLNGCDVGGVAVDRSGSVGVLAWTRDTNPDGGVADLDFYATTFTLAGDPPVQSRSSSATRTRQSNGSDAGVIRVEMAADPLDGKLRAVIVSGDDSTASADSGTFAWAGIATAEASWTSGTWQAGSRAGAVEYDPGVGWLMSLGIAANGARASVAYQGASGSPSPDNVESATATISGTGVVSWGEPTLLVSAELIYGLDLATTADGSVAVAAWSECVSFACTVSTTSATVDDTVQNWDNSVQLSPPTYLASNVRLDMSDRGTDALTAWQFPEYFQLPGIAWSGSWAPACVMDAPDVASMPGTASNPYQVGMSEDLIRVGACPSGSYFAQTGDIDLSIGRAGRTWTPVSLDGIYDGGDDTISNLVFSAPGPNLGLFASTTSDDTIENLHLAGFDITATSSNTNVGRWVGALVGTSLGTISNVEVNSSRITGMSTVGGLAGWARGRVVDSSSTVTVTAGVWSGGLVGAFDGITASIGILRSFSAQPGTVSGSGTQIGGLVGRLDAGRVNQSFSTMNVTGSGTQYGGLIGAMQGSAVPVSVVDSYATGSVSTTSTVSGGLIGYFANGTVTGSWANGTVTASSGAGGLTGSGAGTTSNSFWDTTTSGTNTSATGTGQTTTQMQTLSTFSGATPPWDISNGWQSTPTTAWGICSGSTYPFLRWFQTNNPCSSPTPTPTPPSPTAPSAPLDVTAVPGDSQATVTWKPPADEGSFPVTSYRVVAGPGGASCLVSAPATSCVVTGLTNGQPYTFTVEALNGAGWGAKSAPSTPVTPKGGPCTNVEITLNKGTRTPDGRHDRIRTTGTTRCIPEGTKLTPYIRYRGQANFSTGKATITVQSDGTFTWTRQIKKDKGLTGYVAWMDIESNRVFWAKAR